jgi:DNA polymerase-3 subunit delta'
MPFAEIVGHQKQLEVLGRSLEGNRLHHAYLFLGPDGVGKRAVALSLAAVIHCPFGDHDSCGRCETCLSIRDGNHPDVRVIKPEPGKREITIRQMRDLQRQLEFRSFSGKKKIAIIDPAHLMNVPAQNSLLKTLEDPPGDALLILISNSTASLLSTVLSRCLRLYFSFISVEETAGFLEGRKGIAPEKAKLLAALTGGSLGEALNCDENKLLDQRKRWIERFSSLSQGNHRGVMALAEEMAADRELSLQVVQWVEGWYRDILIHQMTGPEGEIRNTDMGEKIHEAASTHPFNHTLSVLSWIGRVKGELQRNYNRRLILENFLIKLVDRNPCGPGAVPT